MSKQYSEILSNNFLNGDRVFFLINCYNKPTVFLKCFGIIEGKEVLKNNVRYFIRLLKVFGEKQELINNFHNQDFRTILEKSGRAKIKNIQILDIIDSINFEEKLQEYLNRHLMVVDNFLCSKQENEINNLIIETNKISQNFLDNLIK